MMFDRGHMFNNGYWGSNMFSSGWCLLIIAGIILVVIAAVYLYKKKNNNRISGSNAIELLKTRFAKGELTEEEYLEKKKVIERK